MNRVRLADGLRALSDVSQPAHGSSRSLASDARTGLLQHTSRRTGRRSASGSRRYYTSRGWRTWSVGEALLASQGSDIEATADRRLLARFTAASRDHPLADAGGTPESARSTRPRRRTRSEEARRSSSPPTSDCGTAASRRHEVLVALRGERVDRRRARIDLGREAAIPGHDHSTVLVDLRDDATIAGAQIRTRLAGPRRARSLAPTATPARILAARSLAPCVSIRGVSVSRASKPLPLPSRRWLEDSLDGSAKSRQAGGSLRTRRLQDRSAGTPRRQDEWTMTSPDEHDNEDARRGGLVRRVLTPGPEPRAAARGADRATPKRARRACRASARVDRRARTARGAAPRLACVGRAHAEARNRRPRGARGGAHVVPGEPHRARDLALRRRGGPRSAATGARRGRAEARRGRAARACGRRA